jgi:N-acetylneuraminate synthase
MFKIGNREIGRHARPYLIAEMSGNHNQSLDRALEIVDAAAASGADAVKLQTYTAETMTLNLRTRDFVINDPAACGTAASSTSSTRKHTRPGSGMPR